MNSPHPPIGMPLQAAGLSAVQTDLVPQNLPGIFRIQSLARTLAKDGVQVCSLATLFHERVSLDVSWISPHADSLVRRGGLVRIHWGVAAKSVDGVFPIDQLLPPDGPDAVTNLFETIPVSWVRDRAVVQRAMTLWDQLPRNLAHMFNALMWNGQRFHRYACSSASMDGHHTGKNGNLVHSVEVAEAAMAFGRLYPGVNLDLLGFGGLVHDAAKADGYNDGRERRMLQISERGIPANGRHTVIDWLATARAADGVVMPESSFTALVHMLNATSEDAPWSGRGDQPTLMAEILAEADRFSAKLGERPVDGADTTN